LLVVENFSKARGEEAKKAELILSHVEPFWMRVTVVYVAHVPRLSE
jgi:hypothetical protein